MTRVEEVIVTDDLRGDGDTTPFHRTTQVFTKDGELIAEDCPLEDCACSSNISIGDSE